MIGRITQNQPLVSKVHLRTASSSADTPADVSPSTDEVDLLNPGQSRPSLTSVLKTQHATAAGTLASSTPGAVAPVLVDEFRLERPDSMYDKTAVKEALAKGERLVYGAELSSPNTATAETMAQSGAVGLIFIEDDSARAMDLVNLNNALQGSKALPVVTFDRADDPDIKQKLDSGALGGMLQGAESGAEVRQFLDQLFFSPAGNRPGGPAKSSQYLAPGRFIEMVQRSNDAMVGAVSINSSQGAANIDEIVNVPQLNLLMVDREKLSEAEVERVEKAAREAKVTLGTWAESREEAQELFARGYREITLAGDLEATDKALDAFADQPRDPQREPAPLGQQTVAEKSETIKDWLRDGKMVGVGFLMTPDPKQAQRLAERTNALWIDAEHGPFDPESVSKVLSELPEGTRTVVRVGSWKHPHIQDYLDLGVDGVVAPSVESPEQARAFVDTVKSKNPEALAVVMVETVKGVENAEAIAGVEGVDVLHMGPFDLSLSLRQPMGSEAHRQAIARVEQAAREAGVPLGGVPATANGPRRSRAYQMQDLGYQFLTTVSDQEASSAFFSNLIPAQTATQKTLWEGLRHHSEEAFRVMDQMIAARDPVTRLLPLNFETRGGKLVATDHLASGLDMGRTTAGLVIAAEVAGTLGQNERAATYLQAAEENWARGKELLAEGDYFVHRRDFNEDGSVKSTEIGEGPKNAPGVDNATRVNPRGYAFRGAAELYRATGKAEYKEDFNRYFQAWVRDFHDPINGGFFLHANIEKTGDHYELGNFKDPGGGDSDFDGRVGAKGNDGTIYALSGVLLAANEVLGTEQTQNLVKEQMDLILDKFHRQNGMLWENYTPDFQPISMDWQNQNRENGVSSHVAIGGHTAMAAQQIIEGARQLRAQGAIDQQQYDTYLERTVDLFQDFASQSGAVDWETGAVHNAIRVEEPDRDKRWLSDWGDAPWQQAELLQSLTRLGEEGRLQDIKGPDGQTGVELLQKAQQHYQTAHSLPAEGYQFQGGFGNPDVYHRPQVAQYFTQALRQG